MFLTGEEAVLAFSAVPVPGTGPQEAVVRTRFVGANPKPTVSGVDEVPGKSNYFLGNDPQKWRTNVPTYSRVRYASVYPGVDVVYYGRQSRLEYDLVLAPGVDPHAIRLAVEGAGDMWLDAQGNLVLSLGGSEMQIRKPVVYQQVAGTKRLVEAAYALRGKNEVGFQLAAYDTSRSLIIDPALVYSSYLGGSGNDGAFSVAVDSAGNAYVTGGTVSLDFPTTAGVVQSSYGGTGNCKSATDFTCGDIFVTKINATGSAVLWSTYLGGTDKEAAAAIAMDTASNVYVAGNTHSANYPTTATAFQRVLKGNTDAIVTKLNSTGSALVYSTYLGGSVKELIFGLALDSSKNAYVAGNTTSSDFPTTAGSFQIVCTSCPAGSAFVSKLNSTGSALVYSTFLGGSTASLGAGIAVNSAGNAFVTGETIDTDFPTKNPIQAAFAGGGVACDFGNGLVCGDAFVTEFNPAGSALVYSTYLGGSGEDSGFAIAVDTTGAYVAGGTDSSNFPTTTSAFQRTFGGGAVGCASTGLACGDAFITKINPAGSAKVYSTYLGGPATT